jgi:hypothetical protein
MDLSFNMATAIHMTMKGERINMKPITSAGALKLKARRYTSRYMLARVAAKTDFFICVNLYFGLYKNQASSIIFVSFVGLSVFVLQNSFGGNSFGPQRTLRTTKDTKEDIMKKSADTRWFSLRVHKKDGQFSEVKTGSIKLSVSELVRPNLL